MKLTLRKSDFTDDWYVIERAEHDGGAWFKRIGTNGFALCMASRFSDADVEGEANEMLAIADAIERRESTGFTRCAVDATKEPVEFWSPRNSQEMGRVSYAEALDLAGIIRAELGRET